MNKFKSGNEILFERPFGLNGCTSIIILQNWRDILTVVEQRTSGTKASDVWSDPEVYKITVKELEKIIMDHKCDPFGNEISVVSYN